MKKMIFPIMDELSMTLPYFIVGVGCNYEQEHIVRPYGFPRYQWIQCRQGAGELVIDNNTYTISENQGMLLYPDEPHEYYKTGETWVVDWIIFSGLHIKDFFEQTAKITKSGVYYVSQPHSVADKITHIYEIEKTNSPIKSIESSRLVYALLMDVMKFASSKADKSMEMKYNRLKPLFHYIEDNYYKSISLSELSEIIGVTVQHLCNTFKDVTTYTITEYINMTRIKKSKELLFQDKNLQIKDVARQVGFNDVSYYCSTFRRMENMSPVEFKERI